MKIQNKPSTGLSNVKVSKKQDILTGKEMKTQSIDEVFDGNLLQTQLFQERCKDTQDNNEGKLHAFLTDLVANAKIFKEEFNKRNMKVPPNVLNLSSMRLGLNSIVALAGILANRKDIERLNLADNSVSDYGMSAVKTILTSVNLKSINLASNMISGEGLELILDELIQHRTLKAVDIGIQEGSLKKNALGIQGAVCISALLIKNRTLEALSVNDNDLGTDGGECIGIALS